MLVISHRPSFALLVAAGFALGLGCAKVGRPPGGAVDKLAPVIMGTQPRGDATQVARDRVIVVEFSERMDARRTAGAVFVSPRTEVRLGWHGRQLEIRPLAGLEPEQTYVITVGTDARDLRGNRLDQSFTFAFATGALLNRGSIAGRVMVRGKVAASVNVWAYHLSRGGDGRPGVDPPAYETQSGRDGAFEFLRLAPGAYRVMAFDDDDGDDRYDEEELLGLPSGDVTLSEGDEIHMGDLNLVAHGPAEVTTLKRVQALHDRVIMLSFSEPVEDSQGLTVSIEGLTIEGQHRSVVDPTRWYLLTTKQEAGKPYKLSTILVDGMPVAWDEPARGASRADRKAPALELSYPKGDLAAVVDTVRLLFNEAMDPAYPVPGDDLWVDLWVRSDSTDSPAGAWSWENPATLVFSPFEPLGPGDYRLQVALSGLRDRAGLAPADSSVTLAFAVLSYPDLCSVSGTVMDGADSSAIQARVEVRQSAHPGGVSWVESDVDGRYTISGLAPGQYEVHCIDDVDADGIADGGQLDPYVPAERHQSYERTLSLSRGEHVDDINFELK